MNTRHMDLWDLVCWVYRDQKAHIYLREKANWFDWAIDMTTFGEIDVNVPVQPDAAMVHAAVIELGYIPAQLIVEFARIAERPEISTAIPRPYPMHPNDERRRNDDRTGWVEINGRRVTCIVRSEESAAESIVKLRKPKGTRGAIERPRFKPVEFCPIDWSPTPEFADMVNAVYREWTDVMMRLRLALAGERLRHHVVTGFDFTPAPEFNVIEDVGGQRDPDDSAAVSPLSGFAEGVSWTESASTGDLTPTPWRYKRVCRAVFLPRIGHRELGQNEPETVSSGKRAA